MTHIISTRALERRINRKLSRLPWPEKLERSRPDSRLRQNVGEYFTVDVYRNAIVLTDVDLESIGRELGVLAGHEVIGETS